MVIGHFNRVYPIARMRIRSHTHCLKVGNINCTFYSIFIIKGFRTIVFIFIVISTTFRPICLPAFFRCLSNSGTFTELRTTSFIESTRMICSDSFSHNRVQVLSIPVLLLSCSQNWSCNFQMIVPLVSKGTNAYNRYTMCPAAQFPSSTETWRGPEDISTEMLRK